MANCIRCGRQLPPLSFGRKICQWCVQHEAAQRGETVDEPQQRVMPAPWVRRGESGISLTQILFGANVAVFLAMALASGSALEISGQVSVHYGANFGPYTLSGEWWRLVTYMFLHGGIMHIAFNMWCLWDLGALCESLYGRWSFLCIYLITGIAGGLASVAWNPGVLSVGASGAIFGLAGALAASFYLGEFSLPRIAISGTFRSLAFFIGFNILIGFGFNIFAGSSGGIDNACHIGGLVSGAALGALIARLAPQHDAPLRRASVLGFVALAVVAAGFGVRQWRSGPMRMAREYQEIGGKTDSVAQLEKIVRQQPNLVPAHFALAQAYLTRQQFPQAEAEFKKVLELQPKSQAARFDLGMTYLSEQRPQDAKTIFDEMLTQDANSGDGHYGLGLTMASVQNYQAAIAEFQKAESSGTQVSGVYYEMGNSYAKLKKYDDAISAYLQGKQKEGDDPDLENALADAYEARGLTQQAQEARNQASQLRGGR
jgi:membrane associated rhomboid family serine protease/Tfp pilus assembly protein PilF